MFEEGRDYCFEQERYRIFIEKQFSRCPPLYSRVGFAHEYRRLVQEELHFVLQRRWRALGQTQYPEDFTAAQAIMASGRSETA